MAFTPTTAYDGKNRIVTLTRSGFQYKVEKPETGYKTFFLKLDKAETDFQFQVENTNP